MHCHPKQDETPLARPAPAPRRRHETACCLMAYFRCPSDRRMLWPRSRADDSGQAAFRMRKLSGFPLPNDTDANKGSHPLSTRDNGWLTVGGGHGGRWVLTVAKIMAVSVSDSNVCDPTTTTTNPTMTSQELASYFMLGAASVSMPSVLLQPRNYGGPVSVPRVPVENVLAGDLHRTGKDLSNVCEKEKTAKQLDLPGIKS